MHSLQRGDSGRGAGTLQGGIEAKTSNEGRAAANAEEVARGEEAVLRDCEGAGEDETRVSWMDDTYAEAIAGRIPAGAKLRKEAKAQVVDAAHANIIRQSRKDLNKTEKRFLNEYLEPMRHAGEIDQIDDHESITLRLANGLRLRPDFPTWKDGRLTFYEVKGERIWEDAIKSLKIAANKYKHCRFFIFKYVKGEWFRQEVLP